MNKYTCTYVRFLNKKIEFKKQTFDHSFEILQYLQRMQSVQ
jgi:hypothetical protein